VVNITISLPEETVKRLRKAVKERYGGRKGAMAAANAAAIASLPSGFRWTSSKNMLPGSRGAR
jgi:hypothetical protein